MNRPLINPIASINDVPVLDLRTGEFRARFPKNEDFFDFMLERRRVLSSLEDFAGELANTLGKCPTCGIFTPMSDYIGIAYVEKYEAKSEEDLKDNFFGCPSCCIRHLEEHSGKTGRISF